MLDSKRQQEGQDGARTQVSSCFSCVDCEYERSRIIQFRNRYMTICFSRYQRVPNHFWFCPQF